MPTINQNQQRLLNELAATRQAMADNQTKLQAVQAEPTSPEEAEKAIADWVASTASAFTDSTAADTFMTTLANDGTIAAANLASDPWAVVCRAVPDRVSALLAEEARKRPDLFGAPNRAGRVEALNAEYDRLSEEETKLVNQGQGMGLTSTELAA